MKMKRVLSAVLVAILMSFLFLTSTVSAYEGADYSMDIPSSHTAYRTNVWRKSNGDNVNVQITSYTSGVGDKTMDELLNEVLDKVSTMSQYKSFETKEVTTISKNDYKCAHIRAKLSSYSFYVDQYQVISKGKIYTITFTSSSTAYFSSSDVEDMLESFTIKNYEDPTAGASVKKVAKNAGKVIGIIAGVVGGIIGIAVIAVIIILVVSKSKKNKAE